ncbi:hypothetical protein PHLGIDRAFT_37894 [Phlebiopsis gigantea 11061_1 CR5-6]|uniref:DNA replication regulator Sld3 C-terminal domain-containing protein n=1 Tax=Phlebiopsis gigantea (strain 11061_1 CR5-6) TaxID=745531 RepID=A0A0C3ND57_PHLG1|nr:hypothetical protein PHLGIDRAFT_37894 [Phlebiopsis gigantea 11061_1 CR5-6]
MTKSLEKDFRSAWSLLVVCGMLYKLHNDCPVKWTAVQERSISREFPHLPNDSSVDDQILRMYHQFLWLPEAAAPLSRLVPALRRVATRPAGPDPDASSSQSCPPTRLHGRLTSLLQTPRAVAQKYRTRLPQLLAEEEAADDGASPEDDIMWYALKHDKTDADEDEDEEAADDRWRQALPDRMERRDEPDLSREAVEEQLEMFMDKVAMWQLMESLDEREGGGGRGAKSMAPSGKGKGKAVDDRDWQQAFCEDIVEALFRPLLPEQCDLLRSKVFRSSPFSDDSDDLASPPGSPKGTSASLKLSRAASRPSARPDEQRRVTELSRTRSLSVTLEEERARARSRSLSIGPQKRALVREVSMSTAFKGKVKPARPVAHAGSKAKSAAAAAAAGARASAGSRQGTTLVAATPVKPKQRAQLHTQERDRLPMLIENPEFMGRAVEGGEDDDEWTIQSSADILFLGSAGRGQSRVLAEATPTKKRRAS